jgi:hypothetical protein
VAGKVRDALVIIVLVSIVLFSDEFINIANNVN